MATDFFSYFKRCVCLFPKVLRPFRILISLLDKAEVGPVIIEDVLLSIFCSLYEEGTRHDDELCAPSSSSPRSSSSSSSGARTLVKESKHADELVKTANLLFGSFESYFIWDFIGRLFRGACERTKMAAKQKGAATGSGGVCEGDAIAIKELCHIVEFLLDVISLVNTFAFLLRQTIQFCLCVF
jgi:hypothetical protein